VRPGTVNVTGQGARGVIAAQHECDATVIERRAALAGKKSRKAGEAAVDRGDHGEYITPSTGGGV